MQATKDKRDLDLFEALAGLIAFISKNFRAVVSILVLAIAVGLGFNLLQKDIYEATLMVTTNRLMQNEAAFLSLKMNAIYPRPGLTIPESGKVNLFRVDVEIQKDTNYVFIKSTVRVRDTTVLPHFQRGIIEYLNNSEALQGRRKTDRDYNRKMIERIDAELKSLDELKRNLDEKTKGNLFNPADLFTKSVDLYNARLEREIHLNDDVRVTIVQDFLPYVNVKPTLIFHVTIALILGVVVSAFFLFFKFFRDYYRNYQNT